MNKDLRFPIGSTDFRELITCDVYVDKSLFIKELITSSDKALLITRPRRSGKTMNMQMVALFLGICVDANGTEVASNPYKRIFEKLAISRETTHVVDEITFERRTINIVEEFQGKRPVIFVSFKDVKVGTLEDIRSQIVLIISDEYMKHQYLCASLEAKNNTDVAQVHIERFRRMLCKNPAPGELESSLKFLSQLLYNHFNRRVYILIDEYDKIFNALLETSLGHEPDHDLRIKIAELMTQILSSCGKDNTVLEKMALTGIFDTLKKEGNSGFNNVTVYGILHPKFSECFGFSEDEINKQLLPKLGLDDRSLSEVKRTMKDWYNGYTVPRYRKENMQMYTPWAVMRYLYEFYQGATEAQSYWTRSGSRTILSNLLQAGVEQDLETKFLSLAQGNSVALNFDTGLSLFRYSMNDYKKTESVFAYLLLNSGYLTATKAGNNYLCFVPNFEVKQEFESCIAEELQRNTRFMIANPIVEAFIKVDADQIKELLIQYVLHAFSQFDVSKCSTELHYKMFILGLLHALHKTHIIESEPESGYGRCDMAIIPRPVDMSLKAKAETTGFVIELKRTDKKDTGALTSKAISQIKQKSYKTILDKHNCTNQVLIAITFCGKEVSMQIEKHLSKTFNPGLEWSYAQAKMAKILW